MRIVSIDSLPSGSRTRYLASTKTGCVTCLASSRASSGTERAVWSNPPLMGGTSSPGTHSRDCRAQEKKALLRRAQSVEDFNRISPTSFLTMEKEWFLVI
ncbi:MAG: hypothetical protein Q8R37_01070 [Nanoarchaeota archaeon]|nr:hypothetical protein [Nanoarchaeota archaeon]